MFNDGAYFTKASDKLKASYSVYLISFSPPPLPLRFPIGQICGPPLPPTLAAPALCPSIDFHSTFFCAQTIWGLFCLIPYPDESRMLQHLLGLDLLWNRHLHLFEPPVPCSVLSPEWKPVSS